MFADFDAQLVDMSTFAMILGGIVSLVSSALAILATNDALKKRRKEKGENPHCSC